MALKIILVHSIKTKTFQVTFAGSCNLCFRNLAREKGIKMVTGCCTSNFSARAFEKLGMKCVYELKYTDYKVNGIQVFNPGDPHTAVKIYVQMLNS